LAQAHNQWTRPIGIFACLIAAGLLAAHSINAFVADALNVLPLPHAGSDTGESEGAVRPASFTPSYYADNVRYSGLFALPPPRQEQGPQGGPAGAPVRASLGAAAKIRLIGIVMGDQRGIFAIVEEQASKKQSLYRLHDRIPDLGEVAAIQRNGIVVRQGNLEELVEIELLEKPISQGTEPAPPPPRAQAAGPLMRKVIDRREVEQAMSDLPKLMTQARAVPNMVNGAMNGFRIDYLAAGSFYEKIGVQAGDVLQRVNGVDIRDPGTILNMLQQLKNEEVVKLDIVRNNQRATVTYDLR
jgi:general secretion pathway protein C